MSYVRVIPRDLFNEGDLLKCLGRLYIATEGFHNVELVHDNEAFDIGQDQSDGSVRVGNVGLFIDDVQYDVYRPLNSRQPWPLYLETHDGEELLVFDEVGELSMAFLTLCGVP